LSNIAPSWRFCADPTGWPIAAGDLFAFKRSTTHLLAKHPAARYLHVMKAFDMTRLTPRERLDLIGELWDSLAPADVRLTPAQDAELGRRMATFEADSNACGEQALARSFPSRSQALIGG